MAGTGRAYSAINHYLLHFRILHFPATPNASFLLSLERRRSIFSFSASMSVFSTLDRILRSDKDKLTPEESKLLWSCKSNAVRGFTVGALLSVAATLAATSRLKSRVVRVGLAGGAGYFGGLWSFGRSLDSCADNILSLDGSRMQKELANIIVKTRQNDPWKMKLVSRYFYLERVFDDTSDLPKLRWRYRNFFSDTIADGKRSQDSHSDDGSHSDAQGDNYRDSNSGSNEESHKVSHDKLGSKTIGSHSKQASGSTSTDFMEDPLDFVFGSPATTEEVNRTNTSSTSPRKQTRSHRRSQRRQRRRLREASFSS